MSPPQKEGPSAEGPESGVGGVGGRWVTGVDGAVTLA